jgi:hypothetical protein
VYDLTYIPNAWDLLFDIRSIVPYDKCSNVHRAARVEHSANTLNVRLEQKVKNSLYLTNPNIPINSNKADLILFNILGYYIPPSLQNFRPQNFRIKENTLNGNVTLCQ